MLVVDASTALDAAQFRNGFRRFRRHQLVAPPLLWSETRSVLHEKLWRGEISRSAADLVRHSLERSPIRPRTHRRLGERAWELADELGWAKTYDAEYLALASLLDCKVVTIDERFLRGAERLGLMVAPADL